MDSITAFGIGALVFVIIVLLTAYSLKSASVLISATNKDYIIDMQDDAEDADDKLNDIKVHGAPEVVSKDS
uniref:Uncharacterized protein n=1 Tax=Candidatus Methanogaster sp. ANME-2c ERB4 TaxID=2759911 RepID=A0A7G9YJ97_9EURY|nr:hypothetical protein NKOHCHHF_00006 [Methanosarcinales archaeon ANME-2c ERB4]